jgi:hypothetical protein
MGQLDSTAVQPFCTTVLYNRSVQPFCTTVLYNRSVSVQPFCTSTSVLYNRSAQPFCTAPYLGEVRQPRVHAPLLVAPARGAVHDHHGVGLSLHSRVSDWLHGPYRLSRGPYRLSRGPYRLSRGPYRLSHGPHRLSSIGACYHTPSEGAGSHTRLVTWTILAVLSSTAAPHHDRLVRRAVVLLALQLRHHHRHPVRRAVHRAVRCSCAGDGSKR